MRTQETSRADKNISMDEDFWVLGKKVRKKKAHNKPDLKSSQ